MTPSQLMHAIDAIRLRTGASAPSYQRVNTWKKCIREIIFQDVLRDATDWQLGADASIVAASASSSFDTSGGTLYGVLVDSIYSVAGEHLVLAITDLASVTISGLDLQAAGGVTGGNDVLGADEEGIIWKIPPAASATAPQFSALLFPNGMIFATNIDACADGELGTDPTANDIRMYIVYRDSTETRG